MAGKLSRRLLLSGVAGLGGVAALGAAALSGAITWDGRRIPTGFLKQYWREMGRSIAVPTKTPDVQSWPDKGLHIAWLGHSTVLMKLDGFTVLTDPMLSARAGLSFGPITIGVKRLVQPALALERLPKVDLILLSHAHMDHFDLPSLRALESPNVQVVTATSTSDLLRVRKYGAVQEVGWDSQVHVGPARVRGLRVRHWGARMQTDTYRGYNGYLLTVGRWRVLFAGDTANTDAFRGLPDTSQGVHAALMPIGAYNPWITAHCNPEEAWRMGNEARADVLLPIHYQTFALGREPGGEPLERFRAAAGSAVERVGWAMIGDEFHLT